MTKILIVGATGYIGENLTKDLLKNGLVKENKEQTLVITVQGTNPILCEQFKSLGCKVLATHDKRTIGEACSEQDVVVNCAGLAKTFDKPESFQAANVDLVDTLVNQCLAYNVKLVHLSSPSVYVDPEFNHHENLNEEKDNQALPAPVSDYAKSKLAADTLIKEGWKKGLNAIILRPHLVYGPGDKKILFGLVKAHSDGLLPLFEKGIIKVDMTYIGNCVHALKLAIHSTNKQPGQIYNITDGDPITVNELVENLFVEQLGIKAKNINTYRMPRGSFTGLGTVFSLGESSGRVLQKLGFNPQLEKTKFWLSHFACTATHNLENAKIQLGYRPLFTGKEGRKMFADWYKANYKVPHAAESIVKKTAKTGAFAVVASFAVGALYFFGRSYFKASLPNSTVPARHKN